MHSRIKVSTKFMMNNFLESRWYQRKVVNFRLVKWFSVKTLHGIDAYQHSGLVWIQLFFNNSVILSAPAVWISGSCASNLMIGYSLNWNKWRFEWIYFTRTTRTRNDFVSPINSFQFSVKFCVGVSPIVMHLESDSFNLWPLDYEKIPLYNSFQIVKYIHTVSPFSTAFYNHWLFIRSS